jgi:FAD/FMN-containing dehydrogenase/Fe-S oxidoreductase
MTLLRVVDPVQASGIDPHALHRALSEAISTHDVRFDRLNRALYATDASVYQIVPLMVAFPATARDVVAAVSVCAKFAVPITARGGGTSQAGQAIGPGVILDCSRYFNRVLEINADEQWVRVEPGCILDDLNSALVPHGLLFAPDVSTSNRATIGGMIANNSCGARSVLYGKTIDHVLELKVVLSDGSLVHLESLAESELDARCSQPDREGACYSTTRRLATDLAGEINRRFPKILRRVGGYNLDEFVPGHVTSENGFRFNLARLLVGSEGTLGVTVEAKLALVRQPRARATLVVEFSGLLEALSAVPLILRYHPAAVEVVDKSILDCTKLNAEASRLRDFLQGDPAAILLIEFYADQAEHLLPRLASLSDNLLRHGLGNYSLAVTDLAAQTRVWKLRAMALGLSMAEKGDAKAISFVEDTAVAPEHLCDYIAEFLALVTRHDTTAGVYAHASVGCLHVRPVINLKTAEGLHKFETIAAEVSDLVLKYGGALSGEHGDGLVRSPFQEKMYGTVLYQAFRELKRAFDPENLMNPGKIVDAPPVVTNLRYGPGYITPSVATTFDFSADGGLLPAVELCAGVGVCRKKREGIMCPSFRATHDERDSTRGRANLLRMAITGQLGLDGFTDPDVLDVLDLCLECKACKSECPTNVDMARLKAEFLHQYYRIHGLPLRNRIFGRVSRLAQVGCALAPASSWLLRSRLSRWLTEKLIGIDGRRVPPAFGRQTLWRRASLHVHAPLRSSGDGDDSAWRGFFDPAQARTGGLAGRNGSRSVILLFPDTFTAYFEPEIGISVIKLFDHVGCPVTLGPRALRCCARPMISSGMLSEAVANAQKNVELLYPWASEGGQIISCEPSCILTIRDDYPALVPGYLRGHAEIVAHACLTFEECFTAALRREQLGSVRWKQGPSQVLVQAHCHQRSLVGTAPLLQLLRFLPGAEVIDLDAGCCGMAGSFGYEVEHYDISRQVGEERLLPAVRQAGPEAVVAAPGFSCRLQIRHFTGREAVHPAALLHSCLA